MRVLILFLFACGDTDKLQTDSECADAQTNPELNWNCDPLTPSHCALPFPSTYFMEENDETETGWSVALGEETIPKNIDYVQPSPTFFNEKDGYSPVTPLITHMPGATITGLISHTDLGAYTNADARTMIIDTETGDRVAHFTELDMTTDDNTQRMLVIHPVEPMRHGGRYVVGIQGVVDANGTPLEASAEFAALRDNVEAGDPRIDCRRDTYEDIIFPALTAAGVERSSLQLAWDVVVASKEGITGKARWMRDDMIERVGLDGPDYAITEIVDAPNDSTARRIHGEMTVPLYTDIDAPSALLNRDADGMPYAQGETTVPFTIIVPNTAVEDPRPLPLIQYGHGLLGDQGEVENSYLSEFANTYGYILFAVDWTGMKSEDTGSISLMLVSEVDRFSIIPERSQQGFMEFIAAMKMMRGAMVNDPAMQEDAPNGGTGTISLIDPDRAYYYGNSQGAILGGAYIGLSPDIERATLGVGGAPYHMLLNRSADFSPFFLLFTTMYPDALDVQFLLALNQTVWDAGEASGYLNAVTHDPIEDTPEKDVLLQVAIADAQVTTLGAHIMARGYGAVLIEEPVRPVWGLETVPSGHVGSALVEFDYGLFEPVENIPPDEDQFDPHESPRRDTAGQLQMHTFFETGVIEHFCDGPCSDSGS
jgi:hypothetical protein